MMNRLRAKATNRARRDRHSKRRLENCESTRRSCTAVVMICLAIWLNCKPASASPTSELKGSERALLIGVENYQHVAPLRYIHNDVESIAQALRSRGLFRNSELQELRDPNRERMERSVQRFLDGAESDDRIILYFSGHGFRDQDGRLFLAPVDCNDQELAGTGISIDWLRQQLSQCEAGCKLLILDACHAGVEQQTVAAQRLAEPFRELPNVVTLASSKGTQPSQIWPEKEQSLFSYWLFQGLKGHADQDSDGMLDIDELYKYVHRNVTRTAKVRLQREQTPVRIVRSGTSGVPVVMPLRPRSLDEVVSDMAEEIVWSAEFNELQRMAVVEFAEDTALGKLLGAKYGLLGRYCATKLQERLYDLAAGELRVTSQERLERALADQQFALEDLGDDESLRRLADKLGGLSALSLGTFRNRVGRDLGLRCRLVSIQDGDVLAFAGGRAKLNENEWAMLGGSGWLPNHELPRYPSSDQQEQAIRELDGQQRHPLRDQNFPFRVRIMVGGRERRGVFQQNTATGKEDYVVQLRRGDTYSIWIESKTEKVAGLRLLVDGLNTLPQKHLEKGITTYEVAPRVNLKDARAWILDPNPAGGRRRNSWAINGFVTETGVSGKLREFKVVDADSSVAARKNFTDQVGLITAAFYREYEPPPLMGMVAGMAPGGTAFGQEQTVNLKERSDVQLAGLWGVVNIRYVLSE